MKTLKLGVLLYKNVQPMDAIGPWEVFSFWRNVLKAPLEMYFVSEKGSYVECDNEVVLKAHYDFANAPLADYFIVPGGMGRLEEVNHPTLIQFIQKQARHCQYLLSVCTGMFLLLKAGLLSDKSVTTYWRAIPELKKFSDVHLAEDRIVKNGNIWISGGVTSGIDLALELIAEVAGKKTAGEVQLLCEYFPTDVGYATPETVHSLPPYATVPEAEPYLPQYIRRYMATKKNQSNVD